MKTAARKVRPGQVEIVMTDDVAEQLVTLLGETASGVCDKLYDRLVDLGYGEKYRAEWGGESHGLRLADVRLTRTCDICSRPIEIAGDALPLCKDCESAARGGAQAGLGKDLTRDDEAVLAPNKRRIS
jgi:hypothetical protein